MNFEEVFMTLTSSSAKTPFNLKVELVWFEQMKGTLIWVPISSLVSAMTKKINSCMMKLITTISQIHESLGKD